jgi:hypothetical protein
MCVQKIGDGRNSGISLSEFFHKSIVRHKHAKEKSARVGENVQEN